MSVNNNIVKQLPPAVTGIIVRHLRKDGGDASNLLQVNDVWRTSFLKAMCNRIEILQLWREGRFDCKYTVGKDDVNPLDTTNHKLVKQVKLEVELHSVLFGFALESLDCETFNTFEFPSAYMLDISIIVCPCMEEIDSEKARKNIADFVAFVKRMCPNIDSKRVYTFNLSGDIGAGVHDLKNMLATELFSDADLRHKAEYAHGSGIVSTKVHSPLIPDKETETDSDDEVPGSRAEQVSAEPNFEILGYDKEKGAHYVLLNPHIRCFCCRKYDYMKKLPDGTFVSLSGDDNLSPSKDILKRRRLSRCLSMFSTASSSTKEKDK